MLAGAVFAGALQVALASAVFGVHALGDYVAYFPQIVAHANVIEPHIERTVSLRSVTRMLPPFIGLPLWAIGVASVVWVTVALWHESIPVRLRLSVVVIGSILMSPHAYIYDLAVLALPLLWLAPALQRRMHLAVICALFVSLAATMPVSLVNESIGKASMVVTVCLLAGLFAFAGEFARRAVDIRYSERYGPAYVPLSAPLPPFWRGPVVKVTDVE